MRALPDSVVFSRSQALAHGWTDSALRNAVRHGRLLRLREGQYTDAALDTPRAQLDAMAAAAALTGAVVSHRSALLLLGLPLLGPPPSVPELTVPPLGQVTAPVAHMHRASLPDDHLVEVNGTIATSPARTVVDVARRHPLVTAVAAIDAALHKKLTTPDELAGVLVRCWNWPGIRRAQRAVRLSDGLAESPLESLSRVRFRGLRVPAPQLQVEIWHVNGSFAGRPDFYWDEFGAAGEADGRMKYTDRDVLFEEKQRQESMERTALAIARWGWHEAMSARGELRARVTAAFERGQARDKAGVPRLWVPRVAVTRSA